MKTLTDKHGVEIHAGDVLFNPYDAKGHYTVIENNEGKLFLGDYESPLSDYYPNEFWEIIK